MGPLDGTVNGPCPKVKAGLVSHTMSLVWASFSRLQVMQIIYMYLYGGILDLIYLMSKLIQI